MPCYGGHTTAFFLAIIGDGTRTLNDINVRLIVESNATPPATDNKKNIDDIERALFCEVVQNRIDAPLHHHVVALDIDDA